MVKIKWRTGFENDSAKFVTCAGCGKKVPQYEFVAKYGKRDGILIPKLDKDGNRVYKNLYQEIQDAGVGMDICSLLKQDPTIITDVGRNVGYDQDYLDLRDKGFDISNLNDMEWDDYLNATNDLIRKYGSLKDVEKKFQERQLKLKQYFANLQKQRELAKQKESDGKNNGENKK